MHVLMISMTMTRRSSRRAPSSGEAPGLFAEPDLPAGFRYITEVLSSAEEQDLVHRFEQLSLQKFEFQGYLANRRIYTFGRNYVFAGQKERDDASIPEYLRPLIDIAGQISGLPPEA